MMKKFIRSIIHHRKHDNAIASTEAATDAKLFIEHQGINTDQPILDRILDSGLFDGAYYEYRYPDVKGLPGGPLVHFHQYGIREQRSSSPYFSIDRFVGDHPDIRTSKAASFWEALDRYGSEILRAKWQPDDPISFGYLLKASGLFDEEWYLDRYRDVARAGANAFQHFVTTGANELRDPGPGFDSGFYRDTHRDFRLTSRTPIEHFIRRGRELGFAPTGKPLYERWLDRFDTLSPADIRRIEDEAASRTWEVVGVLIVTADSVARFETVLRSWTDQLCARWSVRVVRGAGVSIETWVACQDVISHQPNANAYGIDDALADIPSQTVLVLGAGDIFLRPHAAIVLAGALHRDEASGAYADHDHQDESGTRTGPVFKPAMSPEFMRRLAYAGPLIAARLDEHARHALHEAASGQINAAWARLLLRLGSNQVTRVPFLLFAVTGTVPARWDTSLEPVPAHDGVHVLPVELPPDMPTVSIIVPTRDHGDLLRACIDSIEALTAYPREQITIIVVDNGTADPTTIALLNGYRALPGFTIVDFDSPFNFSAICNAGAAASDADILLFLNNDTTVNRPDWLARLVEQAAKPGAGCIGAQLLYPDGTVQHGGVVLGVKGLGAHRLAGMDSTAAAAIDVTREMVSVTGACLAIRRDVFREVGGFDPILQVAFNDVDLCARTMEAGYRNMYVAEPLLFHHESKSRGFDTTRARQHRNAREAVYARQRHADLFRDDPSYSPNLSLDAIGELAFPPRIIRPWRRSQADTKRVLLLNAVHGLGHGVATVVAQQAALLRHRGWEVVIGGPPMTREMPYPGCRRVNLWDPDEAAAFAIEEGIDCVIAHTPPFFSIVRYLGAVPLIYFTEHGEPHPRLFEDAEFREDVNWEKRFCAPLARRVFAISRAVAREQYRADAIIVRNGNSHLDAWSDQWAERRQALRQEFGFTGRFVVLNVCRFGVGERRYKGVDRYGEVASDLPYLHPDVADRVLFVLAGRGDEQDVEHATALGLTVFSNVTDERMKELYVAGDLYMNLSEWEGYNLGIGQALALGLPVLASDIDAHREFGVEVTNSVPDLCAAVVRRAGAFNEDAAGRHAIVHPWEESLTRMAEVIEADLEVAQAGWRS